MNKANVNIKNETFWFSMCIGTGVSLVTSLLIILLSSMCLSNEYMELSAGPYVVIGGQFISAFTGALIAGKTTKAQSRLLSCCTAAALFYLVYICIGMLVFDGLTSQVFSGALACAAGCVAAILSCFKAKRINNGKRRKKRSR